MPDNRNYRLIEFVSWVTPDGVEYPLFGGRRALLGWNGFGMPPIEYLTDRGPNQHGVTIRDFRLQPRVVDLLPFEQGGKRQDYWNNQGQLADMFRPNRGGAGRVVVVLPDGTMREIFARVQEGPRGDYDATAGPGAWDVREAVRLIAEYPVWRDPDSNSVTFTVVPVDSCIEICIPFCIGSGNINATADITYGGTWESYPTITLTGPMSRPSIANLTTGETIALNYNIAAGETVTITLGPQIDTIVNNLGNNLIGAVEDENDLSTFHLEVAPVAVGGVNAIRVIAANGVVGQTAISISYYTYYLGVPK